jgi:hypothetical protein
LLDTTIESQHPEITQLFFGQTLRDLQINYPDRVFKVIRYPSVDRLVEVLDSKLVKPAQARFAQLLKRKAAKMGVVDV